MRKAIGRLAIARVLPGFSIGKAMASAAGKSVMRSAAGNAQSKTSRRRKSRADQAASPRTKKAPAHGIQHGLAGRAVEPEAVALPIVHQQAISQIQQEIGEALNERLDHFQCELSMTMLSPRMRVLVRAHESYPSHRWSSGTKA